jgi:hypothetical protein
MYRGYIAHDEKDNYSGKKGLNPKKRLIHDILVTASLSKKEIETTPMYYGCIAHHEKDDECGKDGLEQEDECQLYPAALVVGEGGQQHALDALQSGGESKVSLWPAKGA